MRIRALLIAVAATAAGPGPALQAAPKHTVLVELFTSQGCSSCPVADALVRELPRLGFGRDQVVPLTFHVDYWDELGWKDPFASPAFTTRQARYAHSAHLRSPDGDGRPSGVYTPQMVIDGKVHFSGARRPLALTELARAAATVPAIALAGQATSRGDVVTVTVRALPQDGWKPSGAWRVRAALAQRAARTAVPRGENAGRQLEEAAVVRALSTAALLPGPDQPLTLELRRPADLAWADAEIAVFVQSEETLEVAGVVSLPVSP